MGKRFSASDMLNARRGSPAPPSSLPTITQLDDSATSPLVAESTSVTDLQAGAEIGGHVVPSPDAPAETYQRATVFLTPDQRRWLKTTVKALPVDGLSASDIVRLAIARLRQAVGGGEVELVEALTKQAYEEAERLTGRRNRGLPTLTGTLPTGTSSNYR